MDMREFEALKRKVAALEGVQIPKYAAGTFTPTWTGTGTAGTFTYVVQTGVYVRTGALVFFRLRLQISAIGTPPTTNMRISGLPITSAAAPATPLMLTASNINTTANAIQWMARVLASSTQIAPSEMFDDGAEVFFPASQFTNAAADVQMSGFYWAA